MAAISSLHRWSYHQRSRLPRISSISEADQPRPTNQFVTFSVPISRRDANVILLGSLPLTSFFVLPPSSSDARERRSRKVIPLEEYSTSPEGLKYYDIEEGKGPVATKGSTAQVHFDCRYRSITAISTRESKLLAGNRSIAQPYEFKVGSTPGKERKREFVDNPNGLFSAQAAPKPPPAMYYITEGMKVGGKRTVIVTPEAGYGQRGMNEIPPGATFELNIELLQKMETSLRYSTNSRSLKIHAKEKLSVNSDIRLQLHGELDTGVGAPSYLCAMLRHFFHEGSASVGVGLHYNKREKLRCLVRGKKKFPVRTDELVTFNIKGRCDFDQDFVQRNPRGAAEFDWNIWKFQKDQDLRLRVGYEMFEKVPYIQIRENNWTLNTNLKGIWNVRFDL
ncbi:unnamed protein product [Thlaspi arvense]|uniref:peptidylprolyl isomerase n=1 Tax=Thlaspi arvense TaxID=13288 RepID=A0AAU9RAF8_THLAR|nr:unnamed protein product [Thlaspi arvense]